MPESGMVHLYVGDGKGKTTAAVGLAVRASAHGKMVLFCQFLKSWPSGELDSLTKLGIEVLRAKSSRKFLHQMSADELQLEKDAHCQCLDIIGERIRSGELDLLVLDEAVDAENAELFEPGALPGLIQCRGGTEVVLTGRTPSEALVKLADYHTEFHCASHPFQKGVAARKGIEY